MRAKNLIIILLVCLLYGSAYGEVVIDETTFPDDIFRERIKTSFDVDSNGALSNAELEAVSAGSEGHNFHIVATEIRRLANNTMNSINEIKSYISNIQAAFQRLINSSQDGTDSINDETVLAHQLEDHFSVIREMTDITSVKTNEIKDIIEQQNTSFNQIVITLRQISSGIESFTNLTKNISETASKMQAITGKLSSLQTEIV